MKIKILKTVWLAAALLTISSFFILNSAFASIPQTQTVLKSYFQSNSIPTQAQYAELIDTMFWYVNQTYSNSLVSATNAAKAQAVFKAGSNFLIPAADTNAVPLLFSNNVAAVGDVYYHGGGPDYHIFTVSFQSSLGSTNYAVYFSNNFTNAASFAVISNGLGGFVFKTSGVLGSRQTGMRIGFMVQ